MSYLVLARKWRPKRFDELVGQEHVVRALTNALETGKVHHAFLFTGTRGVGKTTIARIFAKSLNCERGTGAEPCGECNACMDIDAGRFVDLLEIDAASNNGVDDVRTLIENAQYMPSRGRTKVYLIDEVHMLSKQAFNALLKTLEEPPGHVKFLLATTDPQKLPVTVLSRCLQFNLRRLEQAQISGQMSRILQAEGIDSEPGALTLLARAADGSLRDGLSLLDQAIAHTGGVLDEAGINAMLGTVERAQVGEVLQALAAGNGRKLMAEVAAMACYSPDFAQVLEDLAVELHAIQLQQLVPGFESEASRVDVTGLAASLSADVVQLWFQMAVTGRRDLGLAPSPRAGFEMALLRMLAFRPAQLIAEKPTTPAASRIVPDRASQGSASQSGADRPAPDLARQQSRDVPLRTPAVAQAIAGAEPTPAESPVRAGVAEPANPARGDIAAALPANSEDWMALVEAAALKGPARQLASHCVFCGCTDSVLRLHLPAEDAHLRTENLIRHLAAAVSGVLGRTFHIRFEERPAESGDTLHQRNQRQRSERQVAAEASFVADPIVGQLLLQGGSIVADSIRPNQEH